MRWANLLRAFLLCATACGPATAFAATIDVTTSADAVADDGACSLREAISAANTGLASGTRLGECVAGNSLPVVDRIRLPRGRYRLSLGEPGEDGNAEGDLDITQSVFIEGSGRGFTFVHNFIGDRAVKGDGDRLFHVDPAGIGGVDVTLRSLTLTRGDVGCSGEECTAGASAIEAAGDGGLTLERCRVIRNDFTCSGAGCGDQDTAAIRAVGGGALTIRASAIKRNRAYCEGMECHAGSAAIQMFGPKQDPTADFTLENTVILGNTTTCEGADCDVGDVIDVSAREIRVRATKMIRNADACSGSRCGSGDVVALIADGRATIEGSELRENSITCEGAQCGIGSNLLARASGLEMRDVVAKENASHCSGDGCGVTEQLALQAQQGDVIIEGLALSDGQSTCGGDECDLDGLLGIVTEREVALSDVNVSGALVLCGGRGCEAREMIRVEAGHVTVERGQVIANRLECEGVECTTKALVDLYGVLGDVVVHDTSISENSNVSDGGLSSSGAIAEIASETGKVQLERADLRSNFASCSGGDNCFSSGVLRTEAQLDVDAGDLSFVDNFSLCAGLQCRAGQVAKFSGRDGGVAIDGLVADTNEVLCSGQECRGAEVLRFGFGPASSLRNGNFTENFSECTGLFCDVGFGGALRNSASRLTVTDTTFDGNSTDGFGGAAYNDPSAELVLQGVFMTNNRAGLRGTIPTAGFGGAIYNDGTTGNLGVIRMVNTHITGNQARGGGGILNTGAIVAVTSSAITGNQPNNCLNVNGTGCPQ